LLNSHLSSKNLSENCLVKDSAKHLLIEAARSFKLSARAYDKIIRISRTIADMDGAEEVLEQHMAEALQYRSLDSN
ncbi:MAG: magnesium chelatase, partial [Candidatus Riflebacteria bacterium]|nr:magnesium chelatase [Candidatus Riflebacteria bacterium]